MKEISANELLSQMRALAEQVQGTSAAPPPENVKVSFSDLLQQSIDKVNDTQQTAGEISKAFELGADNISLEEVMIARQKASVSFQSMLQVRNKLVEAYKEVMAMQV